MADDREPSTLIVINDFIFPRNGPLKLEQKISGASATHALVESDKNTPGLLLRMSAMNADRRVSPLHLVYS
jgi:hypothetical protein